MPTDNLSSWNQLTHPQRLRRAYELGRDPQSVELIDELERGSSFERRLALQSIHGSRDAERALRLTQDASRMVRGGAVKLLLMFGGPEIIGPIFQESGATTRKSIVKILAKRGRKDVIDSVL